MPMINHENIADSNERIYCCLRNKVVSLDDAHKTAFCGSCKMYRGDAGGAGVECAWDDARDITEPYRVADPYAEWRSNQKRKVKPPVGLFASPQDAWNALMISVDPTVPKSG